MMCDFIFYFASRSRSTFKFEFDSQEFEFIKKDLKIEKFSFLPKLPWAKTPTVGPAWLPSLTWPSNNLTRPDLTAD
jgi:hypothetical protein